MDFFLSKEVSVEIEGFKVYGMLMRYQLDYREGHLPSLLILHSTYGRIIMMTWDATVEM